jgi:Cu/Ag efflux pump CusA
VPGVTSAFAERLVRYPRELRDSLEQLRSLPIVNARGQRLILSDVATVRIDAATEGKANIAKRIMTSLSTWEYK